MSTMSTHHRPVLAVLAFLGALGGACATEDKPPVTPATSPQTLIGDAACDNDTQCATIGIGAKACGGPSSYLAWSTQRTDGERLRALVERDAEAQRKAMAARGMLSDCAVVPDPGAYCDRTPGRGTCRLRSGPSRLPAIR